MSRRMLAVLSLVIAFAASPAVAWAPLTCSPGFWKTHLLDAKGPFPALCTLIVPDGTLSCPDLSTECSGTCTCQELVDLLTPQSGFNPNEAQRNAATSCLNNSFLKDLGIIVCED